MCPLPSSLEIIIFFVPCLHPTSSLCHSAGLSLSVAYRLNQSSSGSLQTELALAQSPLEVSAPLLLICLFHLFPSSFMLSIICSLSLLLSFSYLITTCSFFSYFVCYSDTDSFSLYTMFWSFIPQTHWTHGDYTSWISSCSNQTVAHINLIASHTDTACTPTNHLNRN